MVLVYSFASSFFRNIERRMITVILHIIINLHLLSNVEILKTSEHYANAGLLKFHSI